MRMLLNIFKSIFLFVFGGCIYCLIEMLFRGHTHFTMIFVGGVCFLMCGMLNEVIPWEMPLPEQMIICAVNITAVEFVAGMILNVWLNLNVWDYSNMPLNIMGQICLPFSVAWFFLSAVGIIMDDYLRHWIFGEEKPRYTFRRRIC
ncbi:putative ABC transporter permease [Blautia sp. Sow4_E7]|uniref:putative ABC transporter permease n=1 Tax=Blautia sp. Sow4_E7 TaxID=3438749 RepID=UPI003F8DF63F